MKMAGAGATEACATGNEHATVATASTKACARRLRHRIRGESAITMAHNGVRPSPCQRRVSRLPGSRCDGVPTLDQSPLVAEVDPRTLICARLVGDRYDIEQRDGDTVSKPNEYVDVARRSGVVTPDRPDSEPSVPHEPERAGLTTFGANAASDNVCPRIPSPRTQPSHPCPYSPRAGSRSAP